MLSSVLILSILFGSVLSKDLRQHISKEPLIRYIPIAGSDFEFGYKECNSGSNNIVINSLQVDFSDTVLSIDYDVTVNKEITDGTVFLSVTLSKYSITKNFTKNLCELADMVDVECKVAAGNHKDTISHSISIFQLMDVVGVVKATDQDEEPILCLEYTITV